MERVLLARVGKKDSRAIDGYIADGGYGAWKRVVGGAFTPEQLTEEVKKSGLRGRGGAGFPTGVKWGFLPKDTKGKPIYLLCNADESEPGTFKDRLLMEEDPHQVIEGVALSAYAIKCQTAYIYIRGEFYDGARILDRALAEAYARGFLGRNIMGSNVTLDITVHRGAGAYICGEETGLIESLEGKRGQPRIKPPFPAVHGVFGCPTIVNNVETLACVTHIVNRGAEWFSKIGRNEKNTGPKLYCLSGQVNRPGVYEAPMGLPAQGAHLRRRLRPRNEGRPQGQGRHPGRRLRKHAHGRRDRGLPARLRRRRRQGIDARLGGDHRDERGRLHRQRRAEPVQVLLPRVLRPVHAVPRGHALAPQGAHAHRGRRGPPRGRGPADPHLQPDGERHDDLRLLGRGDRPAALVGDEVPGRVPAPRRAQALHASARRQPW